MGARLRIRSWAAERPLGCFFVLAFLLSWLGWAPLAAEAIGFVGYKPTRYLHLLGSLGPLLAALAMTATVHGRSGLRTLGRRMVFPGAGSRWLAIAVLGPIALFVISLVAVGLVTGELPELADIGASEEYPSLSLVFYWLATIVFYGFGEEVGWRGYALPHLQEQRSALRSALLLSIPWAAWHLPLFTFSEGLRELGPAGLPFWYGSILVGSVLTTWLFNSSRGSIAVVAIFHGVLDIVFNSPVSDAFNFVIGALVTASGIVIWRSLDGETLSHRGKVTWSQIMR